MASDQNALTSQVLDDKDTGVPVVHGMVQNTFDMITAVFDSSEDEDTLQPHEQSTLATQSDTSFTQITTDTALRAELSNIAHDYEHSGAQASEVLSCLGLSAGSMTAVGQQTLAYIAGIAHSLQLQGCEKYMFLVALIQLGERQHELQCAQAKAEELHQWLSQHQQLAVQQVQKLQSTLANTQQQAEATAEKAGMHRQNIQLLFQKGEQYDQQISCLDNLLSETGFEPKLRHTDLMHRQTAYNAQLTKVTEKEQKLASFLDLPPDLTAAKRVYNQQMQSLLDTRKQLEDGLAFL